MTSKEIWKIIDWLNWETACEKENEKDDSTRPYRKLGIKLAKKYPENILEIRDFVRKERKKLCYFLSNHGIVSGNDSGWDLTAHIIGCGKKYIDDIKDKVKSGQLNQIKIYNIPYVENFQYTFSRAIEQIADPLKVVFEAKGGKLGVPSDEEVYKIWLRDRKIDRIIK